MTPRFLSEQLAARALEAAAGYRQPLYVTNSGHQTTAVSTALVAGCHLTLPVEPHFIYAMEALLAIDTSVAGKASMHWQYPNDAALNWAASSAPAVCGNTGKAGTVIARPSGTLITGSKTGALTLTWTGGPPTAKGAILRQGSWLKLSKLADGTAITTAIALAPPRVVPGATTLLGADAGNAVEVDASGPSVVTIPPASTVPWTIGTIIEIMRRGPGVTSVSPGAGVTLRTATSTLLRAQWSTCTLRYASADEWILAGDLA